jgi:hypothetical protein
MPSRCRDDCGLVDDLNHVVDDLVIDVNFPAFVLEIQHVLRRQHRFNRLAAVAVGERFRISFSASELG